MDRQLKLVLWAVVIGLLVSVFGGIAMASPHNPNQYGGAPCHTHWEPRTNEWGQRVDVAVAQHCVQVRRYSPPQVIIVKPRRRHHHHHHGHRGGVWVNTPDFGFRIGW